jgi:hypothetical protein
VRFDATGKVSLDHLYVQPDPRAYFSTLRELGYCIPQLAKPHFAKQIQEFREFSRKPTINILDIGCSYGINAVLLNYDASMDELYEHYDALDSPAQTRNTVLTCDWELVRSRNRLAGARFVGLDNSFPALSYALTAGFIDDAVHADLETREPTELERGQLAETDLVISTGCLGYVSERTLSRVVMAAGERKPWMAHFVLRMFPFEPIEESLAGLGYETIRMEGVFKQRRFVSVEEQALVLDTLSSVGVDPRGMETYGWLYAQLYISRPCDVKDHTVVDLESIVPSSRSRSRRSRGSS